MTKGIFRQTGAALLIAALALVLTGSFSPVQAQDDSTPTIEEKTEGMQKMDGFFPMYWDEQAGTLWLEIGLFDTEVLYARGLAAGLGSNDIGLDRGQSGGSRIVTFQRVGPKILMVQPNYAYRSSSDDPDERRAVEEGFAISTLWGFTVAAETDGRVLVDTTDFLIRDAHNVIGRLRQRTNSTYRLDTSRSAIHLPYTKAFPKNSEMDVTLTYTSDQPGGMVGSVAPSAGAVTLRLHYSLVELPGPGFTPREADPRSGVGAISYRDYSTPLGEPMVKRFARRHRLEKQNPTAEVSEPVEPIVYHLDRGAPEPVRSALLDGAGWWNQAFEATGYRNAFRVERFPEGADKMDVRYNVINWVHRSTRGWSSGGSVTDPRTGEIIRGQVTLGSLRVRQDYLIAEGLLLPYENGTEAPPELEAMALARIRQLAAHEVGHTLGFGHNYYASPLGRVSVLDYPHPLITLLQNGTLDFSEAYDVGIGEWDNVFVEWAYQDFPDGTDEDAALKGILSDARARGLMYMSNQDTQVSPLVHQWANGRDPGAELDRLMDLRRNSLNRFGENSIKLGMPLATMEEVLVPLYLHHRYQIIAAASGLGGMNYTYALRGDGQVPLERVSGNAQRRVLDSLIRTLHPAELTLPQAVLDNLPPRPSGFGRNRELFPRYTGGMFDAITPAVSLAEITVSNMLNEQRAARLVEQNALDSTLPGLDEVLGQLIAGTFGVEPADAYQAEILRAVERVVVDGLSNLAAGADMPQVRAITTYRLRELNQRSISNSGRGDVSNRAHFALLATDIGRFLERPADAYQQPDAPNLPPGEPIGDPALDWLTGTSLWCSEWDQ